MWSHTPCDIRDDTFSSSVKLWRNRAVNRKSQQHDSWLYTLPPCNYILHPFHIVCSHVTHVESVSMQSIHPFSVSLSTFPHEWGRHTHGWRSRYMEARSMGRQWRWWRDFCACNSSWVVIIPSHSAILYHIEVNSKNCCQGYLKCRRSQMQKPNPSQHFPATCQCTTIRSSSTSSSISRAVTTRSSSLMKGSLSSKICKDTTFE